MSCLVEGHVVAHVSREAGKTKQACTNIVTVLTPEWRIGIRFCICRHQPLTIGAMATLAFCSINDQAFFRTRCTIEVFGGLDASAFRGAVFGNCVSNPLDIGNHRFHFAAIAVKRRSIQASFHAIVYPFVNGFNGSAPVAKLWIIGCNGSVIVSPSFSSCIEVTVLAIHPIGDMCHRTIGPKVLGCVGNQVFTINHQRPFFSLHRPVCEQTWCRPSFTHERRYFLFGSVDKFNDLIGDDQQQYYGY